MRPQLAMAAILVLVLGSSMLLLRSTPGTVRSVSSEDVTSEKGVSATKDPAATRAPSAGPLIVAEGRAEENDARGLANEGPRHAAAATASADDRSSRAEAVATKGKANAVDAEAADGGDGRFQRGLARYRAGDLADARKDFAAAHAAGGEGAALAALYEARSVRGATGCKDAVPRYEQIRKSYGATGVGADAAFEQAECHRQLGDSRQARELLVALNENPEYRARAGEALSQAGSGTSGSKAVSAPKKTAAASPAAAASPKSPADAPNAAAKKSKPSEQGAADAKAF